MSWVLAGTAAVSLTGSAIKYFNGKSQKKQADAINPVNPGYQLNYNVLDNARTLGDRYGNYTLPGYAQDQNNINNSYQDAFTKGAQGATSGGDISDLATKLAFGKNVAENNLAVQNAQGKEGALGSYIDANAAAGREYQGKNEYDRDQYNKALLQKAALTQAGNTNEYNAIDTGASVLSKAIMPQASISDQTNNKNVTAGQSIFDASTTPANRYGLNPYQDASGNMNWGKFMMNNYTQ